MTLTSKQRAELRAEAHHLKPVVHVGHQGLTPALIASLDDALRTMELVKVQLARTVDEKPKAAAATLAEATGLPVMTAFRRHDVFPNDHPLFIGSLSLGAPAEVVERARNADVVLAIGDEDGNSSGNGAPSKYSQPATTNASPANARSAPNRPVTAWARSRHGPVHGIGMSVVGLGTS